MAELLERNNIYTLETDESSVLGSAEMVETPCSPCTQEGREIAADHFCFDCDGFVCRACVKEHKESKFSSMRAHKIVSKEELDEDRQTRVKRAAVGQEERCDVHPGNVIDMYCETDEVACCGSCAILSHRSCKHVVYIPEVAVDIQKSVEYLNLQVSLAKTMAEMKNLLQARKDDKCRVNEQRENAMVAKNALREQMEKLIDAMDKTTEKELEEKHKKLTEAIDNDIATVNASIRSLEAVDKEIKSVESKSDTSVFICAKTGKKKVTDMGRICIKISEVVGREGLNFKCYKIVEDSFNKSLGLFSKAGDSPMPLIGLANCRKGLSEVQFLHSLKILADGAVVAQSQKSETKPLLKDLVSFADGGSQVCKSVSYMPDATVQPSPMSTGFSLGFTCASNETADGKSQVGESFPSKPDAKPVKSDPISTGFSFGIARDSKGTDAGESQTGRSLSSKPDAKPVKCDPISSGFSFGIARASNETDAVKSQAGWSLSSKPDAKPAKSDPISTGFSFGIARAANEMDTSKSQACESLPSEPDAKLGKSDLLSPGFIFGVEQASKQTCADKSQAGQFLSSKPDAKPNPISTGFSFGFAHASNETADGKIQAGQSLSSKPGVPIQPDSISSGFSIGLTCSSNESCKVQSTTANGNLSLDVVSDPGNIKPCVPLSLDTASKTKTSPNATPMIVKNESSINEQSLFSDKKGASSSDLFATSNSNPVCTGFAFDKGFFPTSDQVGFTPVAARVLKQAKHHKHKKLNVDQQIKGPFGVVLPDKRDTQASSFVLGSDSTQKRDTEKSESAVSFDHVLKQDHIKQSCSNIMSLTTLLEANPFASKADDSKVGSVTDVSQVDIQYKAPKEKSEKSDDGSLPVLSKMAAVGKTYTSFPGFTFDINSPSKSDTKHPKISSNIVPPSYQDKTLNNALSQYEQKTELPSDQTKTARSNTSFPSFTF